MLARLDAKGSLIGPQPQGSVSSRVETRFSLLVVSIPGGVVERLEHRGWLSAKRLQVERLELGIRHKSWCEALLKKLGRPFAVEKSDPT